MKKDTAVLNVSTGCCNIVTVLQKEPDTTAEQVGKVQLI